MKTIHMPKIDFFSLRLQRLCDNKLKSLAFVIINQIFIHNLISQQRKVDIFLNVFTSYCDMQVKKSFRICIAFQIHMLMHFATNTFKFQFELFNLIYVTMPKCLTIMCIVQCTYVTPQANRRHRDGNCI